MLPTIRSRHMANINILLVWWDLRVTHPFFFVFTCWIVVGTARAQTSEKPTRTHSFSSSRRFLPTCILYKDLYIANYADGSVFLLNGRSEAVSKPIVCLGNAKMQNTTSTRATVQLWSFRMRRPRPSVHSLCSCQNCAAWVSRVNAHKTCLLTRGLRLSSV